MKLLTVKEVAQLLGSRPTTIYQWAELGQIPSYKINGLLRFSEEEVLKWIEGCKTPAMELSYSGAGRRPGKEGKR